MLHESWGSLSHTVRTRGVKISHSSFNIMSTVERILRTNQNGGWDMKWEKYTTEETDHKTRQNDYWVFYFMRHTYYILITKKRKKKNRKKKQKKNTDTWKHLVHQKSQWCKSLVIIPYGKAPGSAPHSTIWSSDWRCAWSWGEEHPVRWSSRGVEVEGCYRESPPGSGYPPPHQRHLHRGGGRGGSVGKKGQLLLRTIQKHSISYVEEWVGGGEAQTKQKQTSGAKKKKGFGKLNAKS